MKTDLTGDGIPESIQIDESAAAEPRTGDEPTIQVFSGETGEMIWSLPVNVVHGGWNNVYLYRDGGKSFLMTWKPAMYQGAADYQWKIFSLTEDGKEKILASDYFDFDLNNPKKSDAERLQDFAEKPGCLSVLKREGFALEIRVKMKKANTSIFQKSWRR